MCNIHFQNMLYLAILRLIYAEYRKRIHENMHLEQFHNTIAKGGGGGGGGEKSDTVSKRRSQKHIIKILYTKR